MVYARPCIVLNWLRVVNSQVGQACLESQGLVPELFGRRCWIMAGGCSIVHSCTFELLVICSNRRRVAKEFFGAHAGHSKGRQPSQSCFLGTGGLHSKQTCLALRCWKSQPTTPSYPCQPAFPKQ